MTFEALMNIKHRRLNNCDFIQYWLEQLTYWTETKFTGIDGRRSNEVMILQGEHRRIDRAERIETCNNHIKSLVEELMK